MAVKWRNPTLTPGQWRPIWTVRSKRNWFAKRALYGTTKGPIRQGGLSQGQCNLENGTAIDQYSACADRRQAAGGAAQSSAGGRNWLDSKVEGGPARSGWWWRHHYILLLLTNRINLVLWVLIIIIMVIFSCLLFYYLFTYILPIRLREVSPSIKDR